MVALGLPALPLATLEGLRPSCAGQGRVAAEADAPPCQEIAFFPRASKVRFRRRGDSSRAVEVQVLAQDQQLRSGTMEYGEDGVMVRLQGSSKSGVGGHALQMLMLPSVQIAQEHHLLRLTGSWPVVGVELVLATSDLASQVKAALLTLVQTVSLSLHSLAPQGAPRLSVLLPDRLAALGRTPLAFRDHDEVASTLCAGYVLWSSLLADASADQEVVEEPQYSLVWAELRWPDACDGVSVYFYSSHHTEAPLLHDVPWPEPGCDPLEVSDCVVSFPPDTSEGPLTAWTCRAEYLTFRTAHEAQAWLDIAAFTYSITAGEDPPPPLEGDSLESVLEGIEACLDGAPEQPLLRVKWLDVGPPSPDPFPMDEVAVEWRRHLARRRLDIGPPLAFTCPMDEVAAEWRRRDAEQRLNVGPPSPSSLPVGEIAVEARRRLSEQAGAAVADMASCHCCPWCLSPALALVPTRWWKTRAAEFAACMLAGPLGAHSWPAVKLPSTQRDTQ